MSYATKPAHRPAVDPRDLAAASIRVGMFPPFGLLEQGPVGFNRHSLVGRFKG